MHEIFIGMTKVGKTFEAKRRMLESSKGALFINYVDPEKDKRFEQVDWTTDLSLIESLLSNGRKVQYNVNKNSDFNIEVDVLYTVFKNMKNIIFCVDEIHLLDNKTKSKIANLWKVGRHDRIDAFGITQRPQELDRAMTTQSEKIHIFKCSMEDNYFKTYGIDPQTVPKVVHKFVTVDR